MHVLSLLLYGTDPRRRYASTPLLSLGVDTGNVGDQVTDTTGVSVLVVVLHCQQSERTTVKFPYPRDELDEVVVEGDTSLSVEDGRLGRADKVGRDNLILSVTGS